MHDAPAPDWVNGDPADLRRWRNTRPEVISPTLPGDVAISDLPPQDGCPGGLVFTPPNAGGTPVVYFHGGGFIVGSPETHRVITAWIAHVAGAAVYSIRYPLAPECPFPAQARDGLAAVRRQLKSHARVRLMGDSAGGLVALWAFAGLEDGERMRIEDAILFYPGGLPSLPPPPTLGDDESDGLGPRSLSSYQRRLDPDGIANGCALYDPAAPGFAFPAPLTVVGSDADPVFYQSRELAELSNARLIVAKALPHGFLGGLPTGTAMHYLKQALTVRQ
jgi:acetyl esterase